MFDDLKDWRFWVGFGIIGYLVATQWTGFNQIITSGANFAEHETQILQGRSAYIA